ncbi:hypothetical protein CCP3SC5AM1_880017 [Gammaproteobacteria bacterium]
MPGTTNDFVNAGKAALLGGGLGLGYHGIKRHFINTPQENAEEDENNPNAAIRRALIPAVGLGGLNLAERSMLGNPDNPHNYYAQAAVGRTPQITDAAD